MSCMQITAFGPQMKATNGSPLQYLPTSQLCISTTYSIQQQANSARQASYLSSYQRCTPMCLFGDKEKSQNGDEASPWKALEKAMGKLKETSIQDVLREQMQKQEFAYGGGSGSPPGGSGGGGGGADGSGSSEDEGFAGIVDEFVQVILATAGFIFLYIYIIDGEDLTRLAKDYIRYIFTRKKSVRLRRSMYQWERFFQKLTRKEEYQRDWLEREILNTPTWWYNPTRYKQLLRARLAPQDPSTTTVKDSDYEDTSYQYNDEDNEDFY